jgi:hypothetical protein
VLQVNVKELTTIAELVRQLCLNNPAVFWESEEPMEMFLFFRILPFLGELHLKALHAPWLDALIASLLLLCQRDCAAFRLLFYEATLLLQGIHPRDNPHPLTLTQT